MPPVTTPAPVTTDEIYDRYLKKAIAEINELGHEIERSAARKRAVPVLGSGHPLGDIMLLKYSPRPAEVQEGVAFFGRSGQAILKSLQRLHVDPMAIYGTNALKFEGATERQAKPWLARELHIVQPKLVVVMGDDALGFLTALRFPLSENARGQARRAPVVHADDRSARRAGRGRIARRAGGEVALLVGVQGRRPLVVRAPAVLIRAILFAVDAALLAAYYSILELALGGVDLVGRRLHRARPHPRGLPARVARVAALAHEAADPLAHRSRVRRARGDPSAGGLGRGRRLRQARRRDRARLVVPRLFRARGLGRGRRGDHPVRRRIFGLERADARTSSRTSGTSSPRSRSPSRCPASTARPTWGCPTSCSSPSSWARRRASACAPHGRGSP